jgi:hypothetical protein
MPTYTSSTARPSARRRAGCALLTSLALLLAAACSSSDDDGDDASTDGDATTTTSTPSIEGVRINELQVVGSHNSYHLAPEGGIADGLEGLAPEFWETIDYTHLPLTEQLEDYGIRQFEIDVFADPEGGHYANRAALTIVGEPAESGIPELDEPGFKVLHTQDFDFRTTCLTFVVCLSEIEEWSTAHPRHIPIMILVETKTATIDEGAEGLGIDVESLGVEFTVPFPMTAELFEDLEAEALSVFPRERIITPDEVRGDHETLTEAVADGGWPTLGAARGRVLFALVDTGASADVYREGAPALEGRLFFTSADAGAPDAAFVRVDDPEADADLLAEALAAGYLVRTRTDTPTIEARAGDVTRRDAALESGAQYLSTDFYVEREEFGTGYVVALPGGAVVRCSPVTASAACVDDELTE